MKKWKDYVMKSIYHLDRLKGLILLNIYGLNGNNYSYLLNILVIPHLTFKSNISLDYVR